MNRGIGVRVLVFLLPMSVSSHADARQPFDDIRSCFDAWIANQNTRDVMNFRASEFERAIDEDRSIRRYGARVDDGTYLLAANRTQSSYNTLGEGTHQNPRGAQATTQPVHYYLTPDGMYSYPINQGNNGRMSDGSRRLALRLRGRQPQYLRVESFATDPAPTTRGPVIQHQGARPYVREGRTSPENPNYYGYVESDDHSGGTAARLRRCQQWYHQEVSRHSVTYSALTPDDQRPEREGWCEGQARNNARKEGWPVTHPPTSVFDDQAKKLLKDELSARIQAIPVQLARIHGASLSRVDLQGLRSGLSGACSRALGAVGGDETGLSHAIRAVDRAIALHEAHNGGARPAGQAPRTGVGARGE